jgi:hypothetical protein
VAPATSPVSSPVQTAVPPTTYQIQSQTSSTPAVVAGANPASPSPTSPVAPSNNVPGTTTPFDFNLSYTAGASRVERGVDTKIADIKIEVLRGSSQNTSLTLGTLPQGWTGTISQPTSGNPPYTSTIKLVPNSTTNPGNYSIPVKANSGSTQKELSIPITVTPNKQEIQAAVALSEQNIGKQKSLGFDTSGAKLILGKYESAFASGDYLNALIFAQQTNNLALDIDDDGIPNQEDFAPSIKNNYIYIGGSIFIVIMLISGLFTFLYLLKNRRMLRLRIQREKNEIIDMIYNKET